MKKWIWIPLLMVLILLQSTMGQSQEKIPPVAQQIAEKIQMAIQSYKVDKVVEGATLLCDIILMTRPYTSWPQGFLEAIDFARGSFQETNFSEGVGSIKKAIEIFEPDSTPSSGDAEGPVGNISKVILNKLETAIENFKVGNVDQAVLLILESLALLTP